jgi:hypothetical protein
MFLPFIGCKVVYKNKIYQVHDRDLIHSKAKIGAWVDNGAVWKSEWISFEKLKFFIGNR